MELPYELVGPGVRGEVEHDGVPAVRISDRCTLVALQDPSQLSTRALDK